MPDISTPNLDYGNMVQAWDINDALMGGTLYMRQLGEAYLPRWPKEDKEDYKKRLSVATLLPAYEETIKQNIGRVFAEPIKLAENVPDQLREYAKNFDLEGTRLDVWAQAFFGLAMQYGLSHALVDYPRVDTEKVKTKAEEKATGARPYVTMLNPRQVIGWKSKMVDGKVVLTALRIKEVVVEDGDDFGQTKVEQIRYLTPGKVEIYRKAKDADGAANWALFEEWQTSRQDITLVTLYTKRTGFMCGSPPLLNMALLNIKHWQSQSEQDNILHVARVPLLTVFGLEEGQELIIGSSSATSFTDRQKQGLEYVEHTGSSIGAGKESLAELVAERMAAEPGSKAYGALSVAVQYYTKPYILMTVPPRSFIPAPAVESAVICCERREKPAVEVEDEALFFRVVKAAFGQRRKTLANALKAGGFPQEQLQLVLAEAGINATRRGETLSLDEFAAIANGLFAQKRTEEKL